MPEQTHPLPLTEKTGPESSGVVTEDEIRNLVVAFYSEAREDDLLGPIFAQVSDWDAHFDKLTDFWSAVVLGTTRYAGRPAAAHMGLPLTRAHYERWLSVWERAAISRLGEAKAEPFLDMGGKMARSMSRGLPRV